MFGGFSHGAVNTVRDYYFASVDMGINRTKVKRMARLGSDRAKLGI